MEISDRFDNCYSGCLMLTERQGIHREKSRLEICCHFATSHLAFLCIFALGIATR
jgi:hypothetical protein